MPERAKEPSRRAACVGPGGCGHVHGGRAYGLCLALVAGDYCPCNEVRPHRGGALPSPGAQVEGCLHDVAALSAARGAANG